MQHPLRTRQFLNPIAAIEPHELTSISSSVDVWKARVKFLILWVASHNLDVADVCLGSNLTKFPPASFKVPFHFSPNNVEPYNGDFTSLLYLLWRAQSSVFLPKPELDEISVQIQSGQLPPPRDFLQIARNQIPLNSGEDWINKFMNASFDVKLEEEASLGGKSSAEDLLRTVLAWILKIAHWPEFEVEAAGLIEGVNGIHVLNYIITGSAQSLDWLIRFAKAIELNDQPSSNDAAVTNELLYGRAGLLYGFLLIVHKKFQEEEIPNVIIETMTKLVNDIIMMGYSLAFQKKPSNKDAPLWFEWGNESYLGAAHGFAGIIQVLQKAHDYVSGINWMDVIVPLIKMLESFQGQDGHFPTRASLPEDQSDTFMCQWCHGAPGIIPVLVEFMDLTSYDEERISLCMKSASAIWNDGLLTKGVGLCHGISGNAYAFLHLANCLSCARQHHQENASRAALLRDRAFAFAEFAWQNLDVLFHAPDHPYSLMTGIAGFAVFILDLMNLSHDISAADKKEKSKSFQGFPFFADFGFFGADIGL